MVRSTREQMLLDMAFVAARRSTCSRAQVGAIISTGGRVISTGYNGAPAGLAHCEHSSDEPCRRAVHAEANAIAFAARHGVATQGAVLTCTHAPCLECARLIINAGISGVVFYYDYRVLEGVQLLSDAGVPVASLQRMKELEDYLTWPESSS